MKSLLIFLITINITLADKFSPAVIISKEGEELRTKKVYIIFLSSECSNDSEIPNFEEIEQPKPALVVNREADQFVTKKVYIGFPKSNFHNKDENNFLDRLSKMEEEVANLKRLFSSLSGTISSQSQRSTTAEIGLNFNETDLSHDGQETVSNQTSASTPAQPEHAHATTIPNRITTSYNRETTSFSQRQTSQSIRKITNSTNTILRIANSQRETSAISDNPELTSNYMNNSTSVPAQATDTPPTPLEENIVALSELISSTAEFPPGSSRVLKEKLRIIENENAPYVLNESLLASNSIIFNQSSLMAEAGRLSFLYIKLPDIIGNHSHIGIEFIGSRFVNIVPLNLDLNEEFRFI